MFLVCVQKLIANANVLIERVVLSSGHHPLPPSGSATCMFGLPSPFSSQDALTSLQRGAASSEVQDLVSSLPPINTVFMGGAQ